MPRLRQNARKVKIMIKVRHTDYQLFAYEKSVQADFMEGIYCKNYQYGPEIRNKVSVSEMAASSHSNCLIVIIFTLKQL